jgi:hypothetical protein
VLDSGGRVVEGTRLDGDGIDDYELVVKDSVAGIETDGDASGLEDGDLGIAVMGGFVVSDDADLDALVGRGFKGCCDVTGGELVAGDEECRLGGRDGLQDDIERGATG